MTEPRQSSRRVLLPALAIALVVTALLLRREPESKANSGARSRTAQTGRGLDTAGDTRSDPPQSQPAPEGTHLLDGRVMENGQPVADARVTLLFEGDPAALHHLDCDEHGATRRKILDCTCTIAHAQLAALVARREGESPLVDEVVSDADGRFHFEGLGDAEYAVWATTKESIAVTTITLPSSDARSLLVTLAPGRFITGRAVDDGKPVALARITAIPREHARFFDAVANAVGEFRVGPLPPGPITWVGLAEGHLPGVEEAIDGPVELELARSASVSGLVTRGGQPVAGAEVGLTGRYRVPRATTDASGHFNLGSLHPSDYVIEAESGDDFVHAELVLRSGEAKSVTLALASMGGLDVTLVAFDGAPIDDATVTFNPAAIVIGDALVDRQRWLRRDASGLFQLRGIAPRSYRIDVSGDGLARTWTSVQVEGAIVPVRLNVSPAAVLEGVVVDEYGAPVEGVRLSPTDGSQGTPVTTAADGRFRIADLGPGRVALRVDAGEHVSPDAPLVFDVPKQDARIVVGSGLTVTWIVEESDGSPASQVCVEVKEALAASGPAPHAWSPAPVSRECFVDSTGKCVTRGLRPGKHLASVALETWFSFGAELAGGGRHRRLESLVEPRPFEVTSEGPRAFTLRLPRTLEITGRVVRGDGQGIPGAEVRSVSVTPTRRAESMTTDSDGRFRIARLAPGSLLDLVATAPGYASAGLKSVKAGTQDLTLRLAPARRWIGRIVDERSVPITTARVADRPVGADGRFELEESLFVRGSSLITAPGFSDERLLERPATENGTDFGDLTLHPLDRYAGVVVSALDDRPIAGAVVRTGAGEATRTQADGSFSLVTPRHTERWLLVEAPGHARATFETAVQPEHLRFELTQGSALTVVWDEGEGSKSRSILLHRDGELLPRVERGVSPVVIEHVAAGHYAVQAGEWKSLSIPRGAGPDDIRVDGWMAFAGEVTITEGVPARIQLQPNPAVRDVTTVPRPTRPLSLVRLVRGRFAAETPVAELLSATNEQRAGEGNPPTFRHVAAGPQTLVGCDETRCWKATFDLPRGTTPFTIPVTLKGPGEPVE